MLNPFYPTPTTPQEHAALIEHLWAQGGVACENGRPAEDRSNLACIAFGSDEFAGDREVACFLASAAAMAEAEAAAASAAVSLAAAVVGPHAEGMAGSQTLARCSLLPRAAAVTLVAVPIHTANPCCRYDPYHLRIVGREVDGGAEGRTEENMEIIAGDDEDLANVLSPRKEGGGEQGKQELGHARADELRAVGVAEGAGGLERAYFSLKGVTYINVHGDTNFQPLEEWRQEKERFDTLRRMSFVRRQSAVFNCRGHPNLAD